MGLLGKVIDVSLLLEVAVLLLAILDSKIEPTRFAKLSGLASFIGDSVLVIEYIYLTEII